MHKNFFTSLTLNNICWILWYSDIISTTSNGTNSSLDENPVRQLIKAIYSSISYCFFHLMICPLSKHFETSFLACLQTTAYNPNILHAVNLFLDVVRRSIPPPFIEIYLGSQTMANVVSCNSRLDPACCFNNPLHILPNRKKYMRNCGANQ